MISFILFILFRHFTNSLSTSDARILIFYIIFRPLLSPKSGLWLRPGGAANPPRLFWDPPPSGVQLAPLLKSMRSLGPNASAWLYRWALPWPRPPASGHCHCVPPLLQQTGREAGPGGPPLCWLSWRAEKCGHLIHNGLADTRGGGAVITRILQGGIAVGGPLEKNEEIANNCGKIAVFF